MDGKAGVLSLPARGCYIAGSEAPMHGGADGSSTSREAASSPPTPADMDPTKGCSESRSTGAETMTLAVERGIHDELTAVFRGVRHHAQSDPWLAVLDWSTRPKR